MEPTDLLGMSTIVDVRAATSFARVLAVNSSNIKSVTYDVPYPEGTCHTTVDGQLHVYQPLANWTPGQMDDWWGVVWHEILHNTPEGKASLDLLKAKQLAQSILTVGWNILEDGIVDANKRKQYPGLDTALDNRKVNTYDNRILSEDLLYKEYKDPEIDKGGVIQAVFHMTALRAREQYQAPLKGKLDNLLSKPELREDIQDYYRQVINDGYYDRYLHLVQNVETLPKEQRAKDTLELVQEILEKVFKIPPSEQEEQTAGVAGATPEKAGDEGEEGEANGTSGDGDAEGDKISGKIPFEEEQRDENHQDKVDMRTNLQGSTPTYHGGYSGLYTPADPSTFLIWDVPQNTVTTADGVDFHPTDKLRHLYPDELEELTRQYHKKTDGIPDALSQKIKQYIQYHTRIRKDRNRKSGKLDTKRLHKAGNKSLDASSRDRVFYRFDNKLSVKNTAISILQDCSGSMFEMGKIEHAIKSTRMLANVFKAIGVKYEAAMFTTYTYSDYPLHVFLKKFEDLQNETELEDLALKASLQYNRNADGESILFAAQRLLARPEKRKIMIVLSDGCPASMGGDIVCYTKNTIKAIERNMPIEIYGVGIMDSSVLDYYTNAEVVNNASELEPKLLSLLQNALI